MRAMFGCGMSDVAAKVEAFVIKTRAAQGCSTDDDVAQLDAHVVKMYRAKVSAMETEYVEAMAAQKAFLARHGCDARAARAQLALAVKASSDAGLGWLLSTAKPSAELWALLGGTAQWRGALRITVASPPSVENLVSAIFKRGAGGVPGGAKLPDALNAVASMCVDAVSSTTRGLRAVRERAAREVQRRTRLTRSPSLPPVRAAWAKPASRIQSAPSSSSSNSARRHRRGARASPRSATRWCSSMRSTLRSARPFPETSRSRCSSSFRAFTSAPRSVVSSSMGSLKVSRSTEAPAACGSAAALGAPREEGAPRGWDRARQGAHGRAEFVASSTLCVVHGARRRACCSPARSAADVNSAAAKRSRRVGAHTGVRSVLGAALALWHREPHREMTPQQGSDADRSKAARAGGGGGRRTALGRGRSQYQTTSGQSANDYARGDAPKYSTGAARIVVRHRPSGPRRRRAQHSLPPL